VAIASVVHRRKRLYLDTSAYLCMLLGQDGCERLSDLTEGAEILSSVLLVLESRRTLVRVARAGALTSEQYQSCVVRVEADTTRFVLRDVTLDLCTLNTLPAVATPRSLDVAHLRTALWFHASDPIDRFVTMDASQKTAAKELGLPV
jgi:hypothetical protein